MMSSIFYDLETTDKNPTGQILNYCFIEVDNEFQPLSRLSGAIRISRLQLPSAGAILANRIDVLKHQSECHVSEHEALGLIASYLQDVINRSPGKVPLIGYNSNRFDLPFLRTSMIRNGIAPYFGGGLIYRDLYQVVKKLSIDCPSFPRAGSAEDSRRLSLRMEVVAHQLGVLQGEQTHFSDDDVELTIALAEYLLETFDLDVRTFEAYEPLSLHQSPGRGALVYQARPQYDLGESSQCLNTPMVLLDFDNHSALWIDLDRFENDPDRSSVRWFGIKSREFFMTDRGAGEDYSDELRQRAQVALRELKNLTLKNFFESSTCYIECDIYRLHSGSGGFRALDRFCTAVSANDPGLMGERPGKDARILFNRFQLENYSRGQGDDVAFERKLKAYALYRYGGRMSISRSVCESDFIEGVHQEGFHPTYNELHAELCAAQAKTDGAEDTALLTSLESFYQNSEVLQVAGAELLKERPASVGDIRGS